MSGYAWAGFPIPYSYLDEAESLLATQGQAYLTFSITDPVEGALTFYWGDVGFSASNVSTGEPVYPCVLEWGRLVKYLPEGGGQHQNQAVIRLALNAKVSPSNVGSKSFTIYEVLQNMDIRDQVVTIYQWNQLSNVQEIIWKGYWGGVVGYSFVSGVGGTVDIGLSSLERDSTEPVSDIITRTAFPQAPNDAIGLMSPRGYGSFASTTDVALEHSTNVLHPFVLGYAVGAGLTVPVNENLAYAKISTRYRAARNDDVSAAKTTALGALSSSTVGSWWIYDPTVGAYAHLESTDITSSGNTATETYIDEANSPTAQFILRPSIKHSSTSAGITDTNPPVNDDPTDYISLTAANPNIGWEIPNISLPSGAEVVEVRLAGEIYATAGGALDWGIYDPVAGAYWGGAGNKEDVGARYIAATSTRQQFISGGSAVYSKTQANSTGTLPEFATGRFVTIDAGASNQRKPLVFRMARSSTDWRVYSVAVLVKVIYPKLKIGNKPITLPAIGGRKEPITLEGTIGEPILAQPKTAPGVQVIWTGEYQKDDGGGTITGTASALITKAPDVARHLIQVVAGKSVNSTSGTLGNFVDQRTEDTTGEKNITITFGPGDVFSHTEALDGVMAAVPWLKVYAEDDTYQCIVDQLNPHYSQVYRSTSAPVDVEPWDIIDGSLDVEELDIRNIVNKVTVNAGHSYGRNSPVASYTYDNPLSQLYWGSSQEKVVPAPWIHVPDLAAGAPEAQKYLARYYGRVAARPRLKVKVGLTQKFYDLRPGHVLQFSRNMESAGIYCPAYRTGRLDYLYNTSASTTNGADDTTPSLIGAGGVDREMYLGFSQQTDQFTFTNSAGAATYTDSANPWQYYDGTTWVDLTGVSASDGGTTANVLERLGTITVSFTRPTITSWKKAEITIGSALRGPCYWMRHKAVAVTVAAIGDALVTIPARWWGRLFEVVETNRTVGAGGYPSMEAVLMEVM